jgi:hypothetical protein
MSPRRKKPGVAFWATLVVSGLALYSLSFGPWCWISTRTGAGKRRFVPAIYRPVTALAESSEIARPAIRWYAESLSPLGWRLRSHPLFAPELKGEWLMEWSVWGAI